MNIIIVGYGKVGQKITERLSEEKEHNITVIDIRARLVDDPVGQYDVMGVVGSGTNVEVLRDAGVEKADLLIAVTGSDEVNLLTCLLAKKTGNCQTIARVRKPEYFKEIQLLKDDLGLEMIINPELTAATEIARLLRFPSAIHIDTFAKGRVEVLKFRVADDSDLNHLKISEISSKLNCDVLICGVERDDEAFIPGGDFEILGGDLVSIVSSHENASAFFKRIGVKTNKVKDTMIVGGGPTAYYLAHQLIRSGIKVKLIEQNEERCMELCDLLPKAEIINGDGTSNDLLLETGLEHSESFVALTNIDEENVLLSLFARKKMKGKVITKINRIAYDEVISELNLDSTIYPKNITAEYIVRFVRAKKNSIGSNIETMHYILDGKAEALEFKISDNSPVANIKIENLSLKKDIIIACIYRNGTVINPKGKDMIKAGDSVVIITTTKGFKDISDILK